MCLSTVWTDEQMNEWLAGQGEVVEVWKQAVDIGTAFASWYYKGTVYSGGLQLPNTTKIYLAPNQAYWSGFHFFPSKGDHEDLPRPLLIPVPYPTTKFPELCCIKCLIKKDWITAIGKEDGFGHRGIRFTIVASRAIFPHYPETEARYEDIEPFLEKNNEVVDTKIHS